MEIVLPMHLSTLRLPDLTFRNPASSLCRPRFMADVLSIALILTLLSGGLFMSSGQQAVADDDDQMIAVRQALEWLAIIDDADYSGSFSAMARIFTTGVREKIWQERISEVRDPLGLVTSRLLESAEAKSDIQGAPAGEYMIVRFNTMFDTDSSTTEAVTMYKQDDGNWKSVGYYVRKAEE